MKKQNVPFSTIKCRYNWLENEYFAKKNSYKTPKNSWQLINSLLIPIFQIVVMQNIVTNYLVNILKFMIWCNRNILSLVKLNSYSILDYFFHVSFHHCDFLDVFTGLVILWWNFSIIFANLPFSFFYYLLLNVTSF